MLQENNSAFREPDKLKGYDFYDHGSEVKILSNLIGFRRRSEMKEEGKR